MSGHKILIELDDETYNYWKQRAERENRSMQSLIASMVMLFPKAKAVTDAFLDRERERFATECWDGVINER